MICESATWSPNLHKFAYVKKTNFFDVENSLFLSADFKSTQNFLNFDVSHIKIRQAVIDLRH